VVHVLARVRFYFSQTYLTKMMRKRKRKRKRIWRKMRNEGMIGE
jgi:hypothetical protein